MTHQTVRTLSAFLVLAIPAGAAGSSFAGMWEGKVNDLPAVELIVREHNGHVSGSIGFYFQTRGDDGKWQVGEKTTLPLLSPKLEGKVLTFETIHHKKHGSPELGPNNKYRVTFAGGKEARLQIVNDQRQEDGSSGLKLTRR
ncbi:MAG: hypothetical protein HY013_12215 [Candidatus Solibacter usitatus]|nr:hypothetical protein [Candidatus Solibacter usitatus]